MDCVWGQYKCYLLIFTSTLMSFQYTYARFFLPRIKKDTWTFKKKFHKKSIIFSRFSICLNEWHFLYFCKFPHSLPHSHTRINNADTNCSSQLTAVSSSSVHYTDTLQIYRARGAPIPFSYLKGASINGTFCRSVSEHDLCYKTFQENFMFLVTRKKKLVSYKNEAERKWFFSAL